MLERHSRVHGGRRRGSLELECTLRGLAVEAVTAKQIRPHARCECERQQRRRGFLAPLEQRQCLTRGRRRMRGVARAGLHRDECLGPRLQERVCCGLERLLGECHRGRLAAVPTHDVAQLQKCTRAKVAVRLGFELAQDRGGLSKVARENECLTQPQPAFRELVTRGRRESQRQLP